MAVVISNMDMPDNCNECPCWWTDSEYWMRSHCMAGSKYSVDPMSDDTIEVRPDDCPLSEYSNDVDFAKTNDCDDCIKNGGDWECDHGHCHKGVIVR